MVLVKVLPSSLRGLEVRQSVARLVHYLGHPHSAQAIVHPLGQPVRPGQGGSEFGRRERIGQGSRQEPGHVSRL